MKFLNCWNRYLRKQKKKRCGFIELRRLDRQLEIAEKARTEFKRRIENER